MAWRRSDITSATRAITRYPVAGCSSNRAREGRGIEGDRPHRGLGDGVELPHVGREQPRPPQRRPLGEVLDGARVGAPGVDLQRHHPRLHQVEDVGGIAGGEDDLARLELDQPAQVGEDVDVIVIETPDEWMSGQQVAHPRVGGLGDGGVRHLLMVRTVRYSRAACRPTGSPASHPRRSTSTSVSRPTTPRRSGRPTGTTTSGRSANRWRRCATSWPDFGTFHLYRPYNDMRFAKGKPTYKTHLGAYTRDPGRCRLLRAALRRGDDGRRRLLRDGEGPAGTLP